MVKQKYSYVCLRHIVVLPSEIVGQSWDGGVVVKGGEESGQKEKTV